MVNGAFPQIIVGVIVSDPSGTYGKKVLQVNLATDSKFIEFMEVYQYSTALYSVTDSSNSPMQFVTVSVTGGYRVLAIAQTDKTGVATLRWALDASIT